MRYYINSSKFFSLSRRKCTANFNTHSIKCRLSFGHIPSTYGFYKRRWSTGRVINVNLDSYVYWTVHQCNRWRIKDQLEVTCYFISLLMCSTCLGYILMSETWWLRKKWNNIASDIKLVILRFVNPVVRLNYMVRSISSKNTTINCG